MLTRRALVTAGGLTLAAGAAFAKPVMTDDGIYREDWFLDSFLELSDDLKGAAAAGKQLAVIWEQRGCPYCRDTHLINFARKDIETYVRDHFEVLELDLHGSRLVTDFDGKQIGEKQLAAKYGVRGTPTIQFFPGRDDLGTKAPREREVNRIQGYLAPKDFIRMFAFVGERAYEHGSLRDFLRKQSSFLVRRVGCRLGEAAGSRLCGHGANGMPLSTQCRRTPIMVTRGIIVIMAGLPAGRYRACRSPRRKPGWYRMRSSSAMVWPPSRCR